MDYLASLLKSLPNTDVFPRNFRNSKKSCFSEKFLLQLMKTQDCHRCMTKNLKEDLPACNIKQGETFNSSYNLENKTIYKS